MKETYLSRFTPSTMQPKTLEALLVQRRELAQQLVTLILESASSESKHHTLLVGPRGIGKTHLISTVYHRLKQSKVDRQLCIAWLREEEWGIGSFLDLIISVLHTLVVEYQDEELKARLKTIYDLSPNLAERSAVSLLNHYLAGRTLLLIVENLDELFKGLTDEGQMRLRAHIQENHSFSILATAPSLFGGISLQTSPFYGFFRIRHLKGLVFEEAVELLKNIANLLGDSALGKLIESPLGRARVRAVHHLAGGNHRVYVVFSQFLTRKSLDDLIEPFFRTLDDLTPYYQSRMLYLSSQQQKIIAMLCNFRRPMTVKEISQQCFISHQTTSGQLKSLRQLGYVNSTSIGRQSYYELREPLMRLVLEVKKHRVEPIRLFIDFLRLWYSRTELEKRLEKLHPKAEYEREYVLHALESDDGGTENTLIGACLHDCRLHMRQGEYSSALRAAEELVALRGHADDFYELGHCLVHLEKLDESLNPLDQCLKLDPHHSKAWATKVGVLLSAGRLTDAVKASERAIQVDPKNDLTWGKRGLALFRLGRSDDAIASIDEALKIDPKDVRHWSIKGSVLSESGRFLEALDVWRHMIELDAKSPSGYLNRARTLTDIGRFDEALPDLQTAAELAGEGLDAWSVWYHRGVILGRAGRKQEALASLRKAIVLSPNELENYLGIGTALSNVDADEEALQLYEKALRNWPKDAHAWFHMACAFFNVTRYTDALSATDRAIALGDHSSETYFLRGETFIALDDWDKAKSDIDTALGLSDLTKPDFDDAERIIYLLFLKTRNPITWEEKISELVDVFGKHSALTSLGQGLVGNNKLFIGENFDDKTVNLWCKKWKKLSRNHSDLRIPVKIMDVAVRYVRTGNTRALFEIPQEMRTLLEPLLRDANPSPGMRVDADS